jgi:hypothetical protein
MHVGGAAQLTFGLGGFLGQDVTLEGLTALDGAARTHTKALFGAALRFHFWHSNTCPYGQLHFFMIAGGSLRLHFDACSHLFDIRLMANVIAQTACDEAARANPVVTARVTATATSSF